MDASSARHTLDDLFRRAVHLEHQAGKVYSLWATRFSSTPQVSTAWKGLMEDEALHAKLLQGIHATLSADQLTSPSDQAMWDTVVRIQEFLDGALTESIQNLDEAYQLAHEIEYSEINAIFRFLTTNAVPSDERKAFVSRHLSEHHGKLESLGDRFGDSESRRLIKIG